MVEIDKADLSVIIPCYRCARTVERAVDSVIAQTLLPSEILLIEDCSGDDTLAKLQELQRKYYYVDIKIIEMTVNSGPATARNRGWDAARFKYIAFLDADDSWHCQKIEIQYKWMESNTQASLSGHAVRVICNEENPYTGEKKNGKIFEFEKITPQRLLKKNFFSTPSVMMRKKLDYRFPEGMRYSEDYALWTLLCFDGYGCFYSESKLSFLHKQHYGASGLSGQLWDMEKGELAVYCELKKKGKIGLIAFLGISAFSLLKYLRRCAIVFARPG